jgi:hypothetical protein
VSFSSPADAWAICRLKAGSSTINRVLKNDQGKRSLAVAAR